MISIHSQEITQSAHTVDPPSPDRESRFRGFAVAAALFITYLLIVIALQRASGAYGARFGEIEADEPSHFMASVVVRDYLASGLHQSPIAFATNYYAHAPYFAIGYWPPAFYGIAALWMLMIGVSHASALLLTALVTSATAAAVFLVARRWMPIGLAAAWGAVFLFVPEIILASTMFMLDLPVTLFSFLALLALIRYARDPGVWTAVLFGGLATLTVLTKYSGGFVCLLPVALILGARQWRLLARPTLWLQGLIVLAICGPWLLLTRKLMHVGLPAEPDPVHATVWSALWWFSSVLIGDVFGVSLTVAAVIAVVFVSVRRRWTPELMLYVATPVCVLGFLLPTPVSNEPRYLLPAVPALVAFLAAACGIGLRDNRRGVRIASIAAPLLLLVPGVTRSLLQTPHYSPNRLTPLARVIAAHKEWRGDSILLPSSPLEGASIADIEIADPSRPSWLLMRPSKVVGEGGWFGTTHIEYQTSADLQKALARESVDLVALDLQAGPNSPLETLIGGAVRQFPNAWQRVAAFAPGWEIYRQVKTGPAPADSCFQRKTLVRLREWGPASQQRAGACPDEPAPAPTK